MRTAAADDTANQLLDSLASAGRREKRPLRALHGFVCPVVS